MVDIAGKPMIQRVYEQVAKVSEVDYIAVATDDSRIIEAVKTFGGNAIMTSAAHKSGTDRCAEAAMLLPDSIKYIVNVQGDEPFIHPAQIADLIALVKKEDVEIATLIRNLTQPGDLSDPNKVKAVVNKYGAAMLFSRQAIPFQREASSNHHQQYFLHVGVYAFSKRILQDIAHLKPCELENTEQLEQLRWLWHGYTIHTAITPYASMGIDTPEDLRKAITERGDTIY
jgi:3-deoxy-manno-octulosonate cytidylyltransferase (CMP-KDO synthetase)